MGEQQVKREAGATQETVLRPYRHLFTRGVVAVLALTTPVFAVLYWLTVPGGAWEAVLAAHVLVVAATVIAVRAFLNAAVILSPDGLRVRDGFGRPRPVRNADIGSTLLVQLYESSTLDTLPQLFVIDRDDRTLLRMRGRFWAPADLERVAEHLDAPVTRLEEALTVAQLRHRCPRRVAWYERIPGLG